MIKNGILRKNFEEARMDKNGLDNFLPSYEYNHLWKSAKTFQTREKSAEDNVARVIQNPADITTPFVPIGQNDYLKYQKKQQDQEESGITTVPDQYLRSLAGGFGDLFGSPFGYFPDPTKQMDDTETHDYPLRQWQNQQQQSGNCDAPLLKPLTWFLHTQIGRRIKVGFQIGSNPIMEKEGILLDVGLNFILMLEEESNTMLAGDLNAVKLITIGI